MEFEYTVAEICNQNDSSFIRLAYEIILQRSPDEAGMNLYLSQLNRGISKIEILSQLKNSSEGHVHSIKNKKLYAEIRQEEIISIPFLKLKRKFKLNSHKRHIKKNIANDFEGNNKYLERTEENAIKLPVVADLTEYAKDKALQEAVKPPPFIVEKLYSLIPLNLDLSDLSKRNSNIEFKSIEQVIYLIFKESPCYSIKIFENNSKNVNIYAKIGQAYLNSGNLKTALEYFSISLNFGPSAIVYEELGYLEFNKKNYSLSIRFFELALQLNAKGSKLVTTYANALFIQNDKENAFNILLEALKNEKDIFRIRDTFDSLITNLWDYEFKFDTLFKVKQVEIQSSNQKDGYVGIINRNIISNISQLYKKNFSSYTSSLPKIRTIKKIIIIFDSTIVDSIEHQWLIRQRFEYLTATGYKVDLIDIANITAVFSAINFSDIIIFSKIQITVTAIKILEFTKSIGKLPIYGGSMNFECDNSYSWQVCEFQKLFDFSITHDITQIDSPNQSNNHRKYLLPAWADDKTISKYLSVKKTYLHNNSQLNIILFNCDINSLDFIKGNIHENSLGKILNENNTILNIVSEEDINVDNLSFPVDALNVIRVSNINDRPPRLINVLIKAKFMILPFDNQANWLEKFHEACINKMVVITDASFPAFINYPNIISMHDKNWDLTLKRVLHDDKYRLDITSEGKQAILRHPTQMDVKNVFSEILTTFNPDSSKLVAQKKIAVVNIWYAPRSYGGAARVVVDQVEHLTRQYGSEFKVVVYTANTHEGHQGQTNVYNYEGHRVYEVSAAYNARSSWQGYDGFMRERFTEFLKYEKPDLVHFHCVQVLSASLLEASSEFNIPYLVTLHDAWWLSDYQFLIDHSGRVYPNGHVGADEEFNLMRGISMEESLGRRRYIKYQLAAADKILAVSESFKDIFDKNEIPNVIVNKNGISSSVNWQIKNTTYTDKVVCGYVGGMSAHKGYDIFKQAVYASNLEHIEILVVDHEQAEGFEEDVFWGKTPVRIIGRVTQNKISALYQKIDVLFAPSISPESFGLVSREAAACGCWIVASNLGGMGEDIRPDNGIVIEPTAKAIIATLEKIDSEPLKFKSVTPVIDVRYVSDQVDELIPVFREALKNKSQPQ